MDDNKKIIKFIIKEERVEYKRRQNIKNKNQVKQKYRTCLMCRYDDCFIISTMKYEKQNKSKPEVEKPPATLNEKNIYLHTEIVTAFF
jgi:hypothetical protein